ncbi:hypothetical protein A0H81_03441 [Grifola frondosa]|uniref:DUF6534 domain-containing protein n=1 Tax=Grifola frondosa TaxID=5627 RepID=A0A1C7MJ68_GRIFR|nr:hypothetical protein A0H81_03441 [Grifola frondosa]
MLAVLGTSCWNLSRERRCQLKEALAVWPTSMISDVNQMRACRRLHQRRHHDPDLRSLIKFLRIDDMDTSRRAHCMRPVRSNNIADIHVYANIPERSPFFEDYGQFNSVFIKLQLNLRSLKVAILWAGSVGVPLNAQNMSFIDISSSSSAHGSPRGFGIDVAVASILIYHLRKGRNGWKSSDGMLTWLSVYTINTGALTSIFSVITVLLFATEKNSIIFMAFVEMQSKLYANSFLGSLNARQHIRNKYNDQSSFALSSRSQFKAAAPARVDIFQDTVITDDTGAAATQPMAFADKKQDELV